MIAELRLPRFDNALADIHRKLPPAARTIYVRFTDREMISVYHIPGSAVPAALEPLSPTNDNLTTEERI